MISLSYVNFTWRKKKNGFSTFLWDCFFSFPHLGSSGWRWNYREGQLTYLLCMIFRMTVEKTFSVVSIQRRFYPDHLSLRGKILNIVIFQWIYTCNISSVTQLCPTLCNSMDCSTPGFPVHQQLLEFTQTHVNWASDAIQPIHPLSSPSPPALNLSQCQDLFKWVTSSHQMAKVLDFQLQYQSFQWTLSSDFL